jgi:hypothetical protein
VIQWSAVVELVSMMEWFPLDMVSVDDRVGRWLVGRILMVQMLEALGFYKLEVSMG